MKVERIVVGKGKSVPVAGPDGEWSKVYYQLEAVPTEGEDVQATRMSLEGILDQWLSVETKPEAEIPKLDLAELDGLPWTTYKTKEPAKEGEAGWIFASTKGAEELAKAMQKSEGKLELGTYEYRFSGKDSQFISRKPKPVKK
ncbi:hypothetical protein G4O51_13440 [Candidatus Bathyarchaeota archaeon A05DMB-2]|nr:hypothetical protein [Candidatus Bathyarchaeota archaeon A05DMB-2]